MCWCCKACDSAELQVSLTLTSALAPAQRVVPDNCETHASEQSLLVNTLYPKPLLHDDKLVAGGPRTAGLTYDVIVTKAATWLILPVVICLSQRLSHACLSISIYTAKLQTAH